MNASPENRPKESSPEAPKGLPDEMPSPAWPAEDTDPAGKIQRTTRWKLPVFLPESRPRQGWQLLMAIPLLWTGTVMPYRLCFVSFRSTSEGWKDAEEPFSIWDAFDYCVDALFIVDLCLNFTFAFYDSYGNLVREPLQIAKSYLKGWFCLDLVACLPHQIFVILLGSVPGTQKLLRLPRLYRIFRLARIGRALRLAKLRRAIKHSCRGSYVFRTVTKMLGNSRTAHVAKLICVLCLLAHIMGCIWYLVAAFGDPDEVWLANRGISDESNFTHWLHSIYLVLTTFTTVGFGDIQPITDTEVAIAVLLMTTGAVVNSLIVSEVISVLTRVDGTNAEVKQKQIAMEQYQEVIGIDDASLRGRIAKFCEYTAHKKRDTLQKEGGSSKSQLVWSTIHDLPKDVRLELLPKIFRGALKSNQFFRLSHVDNVILALAASAHLTIKTFRKDSTLYSYGDSPSGMYLIQQGTVTHVCIPSERGGISDPAHVWGLGSKDTCSQYCYLLCGYNGYVGEWELIYPHPRVSTVRVEQNASCLYLPRHGFLQLVSSFPQFFESVKRVARRREERRLKKLKEHRWEFDVVAFAVVQLQKIIRGFQVRKKRRGALFLQGAKKVVFTNLIASSIKENKGVPKERKAVPVAQAKVEDRPLLPSVVPEVSSSEEVEAKCTPEVHRSSTVKTSDVIQEAETLLGSQNGTPSPVRNQVSISDAEALLEQGSSDCSSNPQQGRIEKPIGLIESSEKLTKKPVVPPTDPFKQVAPTRLMQPLPEIPAIQKKMMDVKVEDMPPWGHTIKQTIVAVGNQVDQLKKNQEEMAMMMQQLYFITFSSEHSSSTDT